MRVGYIRHSTREQPTTLASQRDTLKADGCKRIFEATISARSHAAPASTLRSTTCAPVIASS